jgi:amino acid transporter
VLRLDEEGGQPQQRLADAVLLHLLEPSAAVTVRAELFIVVVMVVVVVIIIVVIVVVVVVVIVVVRVVSVMVVVVVVVMVIVVVVMIVVVIRIVGVVVVAVVPQTPMAATPTASTAPAAGAVALVLVVTNGAVPRDDPVAAVIPRHQCREAHGRRVVAATVAVMMLVVAVVVIVIILVVVVVLVGWTRRQDGAGLAGDGELANAERLGALWRLRDDGEEGREEEQDGGDHRDVRRRGRHRLVA